MAKKMRKLIALVTVLVMCISMTTISVSAENTEEEPVGSVVFAEENSNDNNV
jgi:hypothetical protein